MKYCIAFFLLFSLASCDYSMYVAVRNYNAPCKVSVTYNPDSKLWDSDTLISEDLQLKKTTSRQIRNNTSDSSYTFMAPQNTETGLFPRSLGTPIYRIQITTANDSVWQVPSIIDRKAVRKLKKAGYIEEKGFLFFKTSFLINNK